MVARPGGPPSANGGEDAKGNEEQPGNNSLSAPFPRTDRIHAPAMLWLRERWCTRARAPGSAPGPVGCRAAGYEALGWYALIEIERSGDLQMVAAALCPFIIPGDFLALS